GQNSIRVYWRNPNQPRLQSSVDFSAKLDFLLHPSRFLTPNSSMMNIFLRLLIWILLAGLGYYK
ncbi:hypothetical protein LINPERHAP1_LOCUS39649, partial [Linum perenne]